MSGRRRGFARDQRSHPPSSDSNTRQRGSSHPQHVAASSSGQALRPPEMPSEGLSQAEGAFQTVHRRGRGGHHGPGAQSYRGRGGKRGGLPDPKTRYHGDSTEKAESGAAFPEARSHGREYQESRCSNVPEQSDSSSERRLAKPFGRGRRHGQQASSSRELVQSEAAEALCTPSGAISRTFALQKADKFSVMSQRSTGSKRRPLLVKANFFAIENFNKDIAFHYDVSFTPDKPKKLLRLVLEEIKKIYFPDNVIAFDGVKNAYTMIPLAGGRNEIIEHKVKIKNGNRDIEFKVAVKLVARVDLSLLDQKCIQILEVVLRSAAAVKYTPVGRSFFSFGNPSIPLMDGLVIRSGLHFSVRQGNDKLFVNFDSIHKAFLKAQPITDIIDEMFGSLSRPPPLETQIYQLRNILKGMKVTYSMPMGSKYVPRVYTVTDVSKPPAEIKFEFQDTKISVEDYFKKVKHYSLRRRHLPCLKLGASAYVPAELCSIVEDQVIQKHLSPKQSDAMIKLAAIDPCERAKKIHAEQKYLDLKNSMYAKEFGIVVNPDFQQIGAHVLDAPQLVYNGGLVIPRNGGWRPDSSFIQGASLKKWTIFILNRCVDYEEADKLVYQIKKEGRDMGLSIDQPYPFRSLDTRSGGNVQFFQKELSNCVGYDLVIVVGNKNKDLYTNLKTAADLKVGICTQFITSAVLRRHKDYAKIIHNIIQKLNAKLGGVNHTISKSVVPAKFSNAAVMYVGADVTHPAVGESGSPSVAAVCASYDASGFQYNGQICIQSSKVEIISDLERIMFHCLRAHEKNVGKKPEIILFFRDGVGEGQFAEVKSKEVTAIQRACSKFGCNAKITFLVVQKRHHARFFPPEQFTGRNKNVPPGTVVDNTITNPKDSEFYLVSHNSPRGCSRPCRYHCLWDDNNLSEDELHEIAYYQCYTYSRCEQSISYPTPTYYAHHAAARGKLYLIGENYKGHSNEVIDQHSDNLQKLPGMYFI